MLSIYRWISDLFGRRSQTTQTRHKPRLLDLEQLEDRLAPATYTVNVLNDVLAMPPAAAGNMSLRGAINLGNASADTDITINFAVPAGSTITLVNTLALSNNLANPAANMKTWTINGPGSGQLTISGGGQAGGFRDFLVNSNVTANVNGLKIINGAAIGMLARGSGGAFLNYGTLNLYQDELDNNQAQYGGAIYNQRILTVENSWFDTNNALQVGGAIYNQAPGQATVQWDSVIHNNTAGTLGGGIANSGRLPDNGPRAQLTVNGGATIECNTSGIAGGGIYNADGTVVVAHAALNNNTATNEVGGGLYSDGGTASFTNVSIQTNHADNANAGRGGGIYVRSGTVTVTACTVAGNTVGVPGGQTGGASHADATLNVPDGTGFTDAHGRDPGERPNQEEEVSLLENTSYTFSLADFPSLAPGTDFLGVQVTTPPVAGLLTDNGVPVIQGQFVGISEINAGNLVFTPTANQSGSPYADYVFSVRYNANTGSGPVQGGPATMALNVEQVNQAPLGANATIATPVNTTYTFNASNFGFSDPNNSQPSQLLAVIIDSLPTVGILLFNGNAVTVGEVIQVYDLPYLTYTPPPGQIGNGLASFRFRVQGDGGIANGGLDTAVQSNTITFNVTPS